MAIHPGIFLLPAAVLSFRGETGARVRTDPANNTSGVDLLASPGLTLALEQRRFRLSLSTSTNMGYLNAFDPNLGRPLLSQSLAVNFSQGFRRVTLSFSQSGQVGRTNLRLAAFGTGAVPLAPQPGEAPIVPLPGSGASNLNNGALLDQTIWFVGTTSTFTVSEQMSERLSFGQFVRGSYSSSFAESESETQSPGYPSQVAVGAGLGFSLQVSARDSLSTQVFSDRVTSSIYSPFYNIGVTEAWSHAFSKKVSGVLSVGLAHYFPDSKNADSRGAQWYPTGTLAISFADSPITASASVVPVIDQFSGRVDPRFVGAVQYAQSSGRVGWFGGISGATSLTNNEQTSVVVVTGNGGVSFTLTKELSLSSGLGLGYQVAPAANVSTPSWIFFGFLTLTYTPQARRL